MTERKRHLGTTGSRLLNKAFLTFLPLESIPTLSRQLDKAANEQGTLRSYVNGKNLKPCNKQYFFS